MKIKEVKAIGNHVVLKGELIENKVEKTTKSGIVIVQDNTAGQKTNTPAENGEKERRIWYVYEIGSGVDSSKIELKKGEEVIFNPYDAQTFGDDENTYCVVQDKNIRVVVTAEK